MKYRVFVAVMIGLFVLTGCSNETDPNKMTVEVVQQSEPDLGSRQFFKIGDTLYYGDLEIEVKKARRNSDAFYNNDPKIDYLGVDITLVNKGSSPEYITSLAELRDSENYQCG